VAFVIPSMYRCRPSIWARRGIDRFNTAVADQINQSPMLSAPGRASCAAGAAAGRAAPFPVTPARLADNPAAAIGHDGGPTEPRLEPPPPDLSSAASVPSIACCGRWEDCCRAFLDSRHETRRLARFEIVALVGALTSGPCFEGRREKPGADRPRQGRDVVKVPSSILRNPAKKLIE
jgi:hypothetical protein